MVEMDNNNLTEKKEHFVGSNTLESFTNIIQDDKTSRINGAVALIKHLSNKKDGEEPSKEFQYSLKRLVRGLSASKDTSRIGFFTTLTTYLKLNQETKVDDLIQLMDVELKPSNSIAKSENANIHLGRILFCGALIKSKIIVNSEVADQLKIVTTLLESGSKRSYLSFYSTSFLVELLNDYDSKTLKANIWPLIKNEIGKNWKEQSLDTLYIIFIMNDKFPKLVNTKFLNEFLDNDNIISLDTIDNLIKVVTDIPRIHYCHHPLYKILCEKLVASNCLDKFWSCIDKKFDKPSKTMEFLSLELLNILVPMIDDKSVISSLLSPNFIQYMLKRFNGSKKNRKDAVANSFRKFFNNIVVALNDKEISSKVPIEVIKKLIVYPGDLMIEKITGTKILQMITSNLTDKSVKKLSKIYQEIALNSLPKIINEKQENWINAERLYAGQLLTKLVGHSSVNNEHTWRLEQLKFLFNCGFCETENIGVELASQCRDMFYRSLDHKLPKLDDLRNVLTSLVDYINDNVIIEKNKILRTPMSDEAIEAWNKMIAFIKKPESDFKNKHVVLIFFTMELSMGLHLFFDTELAISSINEIQSCSERLMTKKIINNKKNKKEITTTANDTINGDEDEPEWVEVIVDLLLSLLSRNNHLLRSLNKCVFPHLCPELTAASIHQILAVLDPKDERGPLVHKNFEEDDEEDDDNSDDDSQSDDTDEDEEDNEDGEEEEEEDGDDDENQSTSDDNVEEEEKEEDEDEDDESDEDEDDNDDYDEDETVTDRLKEALHQVLGASAQTDNDDNDDIDIDDIDEEEGKRLDKKLSEAFKILRQNRRNQKKKQKKTAEALTHFRVRVIDLLEIYIDCGPSMAIALDMLVPLFALLEFSIKDQHQKPLENRVRSCLKKLSTVKKFKDHNGVDETLLSDMAKLLILKGERSTAICQEMGDKLAQCCTFLIRCTQQAGLPPSTLVDIYSENLTSFFKKRDCILSAVLFRSALQLSWTGTWELIPSIIDFAFDNTTRSFRRGQALDLLTVFYHNHRMITSEEHQSLRAKLEVKLFNYSLNWFNEFNESRDDKQNASIGKKARQKFVCLLWTLLKAVHSRHIKKSWNWKKIGDAMVEYRKQVSLSKDAKSAYNRLAQAIGAPINIKTIIKNPTTPTAAGTIKTPENGDATVNDNETDDDDDNDDNDNNDNDKKKKNHKNKHDAKKQKKEAKQLRAKAMAKGFEDVHFDNLDIFNGSHDDGNVNDDKQQENMEIENGNNDNDKTENIIDENTDDTSSKKRKSTTSSDDTPVKTKKKKKTQK